MASSERIEGGTKAMLAILVWTRLELLDRQSVNALQPLSFFTSIFNRPTHAVQVGCMHVCLEIRFILCF